MGLLGAFDIYMFAFSTALLRFSDVKVLNSMGLVNTSTGVDASMEIETFFKQQMKTAETRFKDIKDFSLFDFNYIPDEPIIRKETEQLINEMLRFEVSSIPTHQAIIGSKGCGKTVTLKFLQKVMPEHTDLNILYNNCREHNTSCKIFANLVGVQPRGASLSELYGKFSKKFTGKTVVILDEINLMSPKDKNKEILYFLSRSENPYMVVMLSNNHKFLHELDASTKSSLQPVPVFFKSYDAQQINEILNQRARHGLHQYEHKHLSEISALTTKRTNSDARVAIKTLFYSVTRKKMSIEACFEKARKDIIVDMITDLSDTSLMILQGIIKSKSAFARDIYKTYCRISTAKSEKPFSYVYFNSNLSYLQSLGLIALISTKVGRAYAHRVMLTFERAVFDPIYSMRFPSMQSVWS